MTFTRHGHYIKGTPTSGSSGPVARCGGPGLCPECNQDAARATNTLPPDENRDSSPHRYKTVPERVLAKQVTNETAGSISSWVGGIPVTTYRNGDDIVEVEVNLITPLGVVRARTGDWVVLDEVLGHFNVYTDDDFKSRFMKDG